MKYILLTILFIFNLSIYASETSDHSHDHDHDKKSGHDTSAVGSPAQADSADQTINVTLLDTMRYEFNPALAVKSGEIVHFIVENKGLLRHEFSIGNKAEQLAHNEMMKKMPNMVHEGGNSITVEPGETKQITWLFEGSNTVVFACNIPGHFEAGMHASISL